MNCIVVPIYKTFTCLKSAELVSLNQLYNELCKYQIYLIGPVGFSWDAYINNAKSKCISLKIKEFQAGNFDGLNGYNKLMISENLYRDFLNYKYVLIYQLDAYVFKDELNYWCNMNFDYIGAPWTGMHIYNGIPLVGVGNGGFSLRKVKSMLALLRKLRYLEILQKYQSFNWKGILPRLPKLLAQLMFSKKLVSDFPNNYSFQEDVFWCKYVPMKLQNFEGNSLIINFLAKILVRSQFRIAPVETAILFSIETNLRELYNLNNGQLPFGCHAWEKYDPEFWKAFIPVS